MTQVQHNLVAGIILIIIYQIVFHMFLKHHPVTQKNMKEWSDIWDDIFRKL
jgi:hypothetical protein